MIMYCEIFMPFFCRLPPSLELIRAWDTVPGCGSLLSFICRKYKVEERNFTWMFLRELSPLLVCSTVFIHNARSINQVVFSAGHKVLSAGMRFLFDCRSDKYLNLRLDNKQGTTGYVKCYAILKSTKKYIFVFSVAYPNFS